MTKLEYNGWTNYETWNVKLWMDNEQSSQEYWQAKAQAALQEAINTPSANFRLTGVEPFTEQERAVLLLSKQLQSEYEDSMADYQESTGREPNVFNDLLNAALYEVNWHEIATSLVDDAVEALKPA